MSGNDTQERHAKPIFSQSAFQPATPAAANVENDASARPRARRLLPIDFQDGQRWLTNPLPVPFIFGMYPCGRCRLLDQEMAKSPGPEVLLPGFFREVKEMQVLGAFPGRRSLKAEQMRQGPGGRILSSPRCRSALAIVKELTSID